MAFLLVTKKKGRLSAPRLVSSRDHFRHFFSANAACAAANLAIGTRKGEHET